MTPLDAMKQALDLMERSGLHVFDDAITNLRAAIKQLEEKRKDEYWFELVYGQQCKEES